MPDPISRRILSHLADSRYRPRKPRELADELSIDPDEREAFTRTVNLLIADGQVVLGSANTVILPPPGREMIGVFRKNERGFGFIQPDPQLRQGHGDLFVPAQHTSGAMTGDRVRARVIHEPERAGGGRSPYTGRILEIIQRADKHYVGNLMQRGPQWVVQVDGKVLHEPVIVRDPHAKSAALGDKVVIELIRYPSEDQSAEGVIVEVLGEKGEPEVETLAVMRAYGLPDKFRAEVTEEARAAAAGFNDKLVPPQREDLTGQFIVTIDPPDAKDYDDAISIRRLEGEAEARFELGVHIADVSTFVRLGGALDDEARLRGNSTYLPRRVVPMLPELLSNGVCSLQEGVNRFCKSVFIRFDGEGNVAGARFANTVIRSAKRLTYLEAQALIDDDLHQARRHSKSESKYPAPLIGTLKLMDELAKVIRTRRLREGMIVLGLPEVELIYDASGRVIDAEPEDDAFTHKIIEMFMVEANEAAARLFNALEVAMVRRVHPDPDAHDISDLRQFARVAGYNIPRRPSRKELQTLLDSVRGKPAQQAVHFAVLRTLSKAEYAPDPIGHFALASEHYTHFTSPIRRYADLIVHRALDAYLQAFPDHRKRLLPAGRDKSRVASALRLDERVPDEMTLREICRHCSGTERNSEAAERNLRQYLVLELLAQHLGEDFAGTVTGMTSQGIFIQIDRYLIDGFIRVSELPGATGGSRGSAGERWRINPNTGALVADRSGRSITIGDPFTVRIAKVNPQGRQMDLVIVDSRSSRSRKSEAEGGGGKPRKFRQPQGARESHQRAMTIKRTKKNKKRRK